MAMVASALAAALESAVVGPDAASAHTQMATAIASYVTANADIAFSWAGTAGPATDPTTSTLGKFTTLAFSLSPSGANAQPAAIADLATKFQAGLAAAQINITSTGFATSPAAFGTASPLTLTITGPTRSAAMLQMATQIITWIKSHTPAAACSGTHGAFTGSGNVTGIT